MLLWQLLKHISTFVTTFDKDHYWRDSWLLMRIWFLTTLMQSIVTSNFWCGFTLISKFWWGSILTTFGEDRALPTCLLFHYFTMLIEIYADIIVWQLLAETEPRQRDSESCWFHCTAELQGPLGLAGNLRPHLKMENEPWRPRNT